MMDLKDLSTRELIHRLASLQGQVRMTPSHLPDGMGGARLNPRLQELAAQEADILAALRLRRRAAARAPLRRLLAGRNS